MPADYLFIQHGTFECCLLVLLMLFLPEFGVITLSVSSEVSDCLSKPDGNGNSGKGSKPDN